MQPTGRYISYLAFKLACYFETTANYLQIDVTYQTTQILDDYDKFSVQSKGTEAVSPLVADRTPHQPILITFTTPHHLICIVYDLCAATAV